MRDDLLLASLETLADQLRIPVTYAPLATDDLPGRGGLCVLHGERRIILERTLTTRQKARLLAAGLAEFDFAAVFILPAVRQAIEEATPNPDRPPDH